MTEVCERCPLNTWQALIGVVDDAESERRIRRDQTRLLVKQAWSISASRIANYADVQHALRQVDHTSEARAVAMFVHDLLATLNAEKEAAA